MFGGDLSADLLAYRHLVELHGMDARRLPRAGHVLVLVCDRSRGSAHQLGRVYPTTSGMLMVALCNSGSRWRTIDGERLQTIAYKDTHPFLLEGDLSGSPPRCDCGTEIAMDAAARARLAAEAIDAARSPKPRRVVLTRNA